MERVAPGTDHCWEGMLDGTRKESIGLATMKDIAVFGGRASEKMVSMACKLDAAVQWISKTNKEGDRS